MISLRDASLQDLRTLLEFEQALIAYERPFAPNLRNDTIHYYDLEGYIQDPNVCVVVAEENQTLVGSGYALLRKNKIYKKPSSIVYLGFMYVVPSHRGQGINARIMQYLLDWGQNKGHHEFSLEVYANNISAMKAYKKIGFTEELLSMRLNTKIKGSAE